MLPKSIYCLLQVSGSFRGYFWIGKELFDLFSGSQFENAPISKLGFSHSDRSGTVMKNVVYGIPHKAIKTEKLLRMDDEM